MSEQLVLCVVDDGTRVTLSAVPAGDLGGTRFDRKEAMVDFNPAIQESDLVEASVARFKSYDGLEVPGFL